MLHPATESTRECPATNPTNLPSSTATKAALSGRACCGECLPRRYQVIRSVQKLLSPDCWVRIAAVAETSAFSAGLSVTGIVSLPPSRTSAHCCRVGPSSDGRSSVMLSVAKQMQIQVRGNSLRVIQYQNRDLRRRSIVRFGARLPPRLERVRPCRLAYQRSSREIEVAQ